MSTGRKAALSVTWSCAPRTTTPACLPNVGVNHVSRKRTPGRPRSFSAAANRPSAYGAPTSSNGRVVPRPSAAFTPSSSPVPG